MTRSTLVSYQHHIILLCLLLKCFSIVQQLWLLPVPDVENDYILHKKKYIFIFLKKYVFLCIHFMGRYFPVVHKLQALANDGAVLFFFFFLQWHHRCGHISKESMCLFVLASVNVIVLLRAKNKMFTEFSLSGLLCRESPDGGGGCTQACMCSERAGGVC